MAQGKTYKIAARAGDTWLIPGDIHFPVHDPRALSAMVGWFEDYRAQHPDRRAGVIFQGDTFDCYGLSRFGKRAKKFWNHGRLMAGVNAALPTLKWAASLPNGAYLKMGNHDAWIQRFIDETPALEGAPGLEFAKLTGLDAIEGLEVLGEETKILVGDKVVIAHGHKLGAKTAKGIVDKYPDQVTICGHYHRLWSLLRTVYSPEGSPGYRGAYCVGFLGSEECIEDYAPDGDMQLGFGVLEFFGDRGGGSPFFRVSLHCIVFDGRGRPYVA